MLYPGSAAVVLADPDLRRGFPQRPRLLPEVELVWSAGGTPLLLGGLAGAVLPQVSSAVELERFLRLLDGSRSIEQLRALACGLKEVEPLDLLVHLFWDGLLESGVDEADGAPAQTLSLLGRLADSTRLNADRHAALRRLRSARVCIVGASALASEAAEELRALDVDVIGTPARPCEPGAADLCLAMRDLESPPASAELEALRHAGVNVFHLGIGRASAEIGPLVLARAAGRFDRYCAAQPEPAIHGGSAASGERFEIGLHLGLHLFATLLAGVGGTSLTNQVLRVRSGEAGMTIDSVPVSRIDAPQALALEDRSRPDGRDQIASHLARTVTPLRVQGYKGYQFHYAPQNVAAARERPQPLFHGASIALPEPSAEEVATRLQRLSLLLSRALGYEHVGGTDHRICPSGGGLGSAEAVVDLQIDGLAPGRYRYHGPSHSLEPLPALGERAAPRDAAALALTLVGDVQKTCSKYKDFGSTLAYLDAGVAQSYLAIVGQALGFASGSATVLEPGADHPDRYLRSRRGLAITSAMTLGWGRAPVCHATLQGLDRTLRARRSQRRYAPDALGWDVLQPILRAARSASERVGATDRDLLASLELCVDLSRPCGEYAPGLYRVHDDALELLAGEARCGAAWREGLINQGSLATAPYHLFVLADYQAAVQRVGPFGYYAQLVAAGRAVGAALIAACTAGLGTCPSGGTIESELFSALPARFVERAVPLALCFGPRVSEGGDGRVPPAL